MEKVSIVLPCLNESENLPLLLSEIIKNIPKKFDYEIILVDDGSRDKTNEVIKKLAFKNKKIKGIIFHRRFGHQTALFAGISEAKGDAVITMDADFQHPPALIPKMISLWEKGHDLVLLQKREDSENRSMQKSGRSIGYWLWKKISDGVLLPGVSEFRLMDKKISNFILDSGEREIFLRGVVNLAAKNPIIIPYKVGKRKYGSSSYNWQNFINMFINGFISFSTKPLRLASLFGIILGLSSALFLIYDLLAAVISGRRIIEGYITLVFLTLVLDGFIIFYLGIIGEYLGVIFREVKRRPRYLIEEKINL